MRHFTMQITVNPRHVVLDREIDGDLVVQTVRVRRLAAASTVITVQGTPRQDTGLVLVDPTWRHAVGPPDSETPDEEDQRH